MFLCDRFRKGKDQAFPHLLQITNFIRISVSTPKDFGIERQQVSYLELKWNS